VLIFSQSAGVFLEKKYSAPMTRSTAVIDYAELGHIVGNDNTSTREDDLIAYSGDMSTVPRVRPACIVKPQTAAQISKIVNLAKKTRTALIPVSSGAPHFRGDTVPGIGGAVIVDLSEMQKILHIDRKNRVVMFEPGVTFTALAAEVGKAGLRLNMPLLPRSSKSVVGSLLEREPVQMPVYHWDIADPLACTEIIFGTGEMFRTGAAAGSGSIEEQWAAGGAQKEAAGPSSASWYRLIQGAQGTMGIVTWVSARCELLPQMESPFFVGSNDLGKLLEAVHWLVRLRLVNECFILNSHNLFLLADGKDTDKQSKLKTQLPPWVLFFNIAAYDYFPADRIKGQTEDMVGLTQRLGLQPVRSLEGISADEFLKIAKHPSSEPHWKLRAKGNCQDILFLAAYAKLPELIGEMHSTADECGYPAGEIGVYLQPIVQGVNCHCEFNLFYDSDDVRASARVKELVNRATKSLMNKGAFFSRPYGENARLVMNRDAATIETLKKVKAIVDPENIMNPGKLCF
jgi:FAD/FMN-containing dehydrogenase